jgi:hypothetical protein
MKINETGYVEAASRFKSATKLTNETAKEYLFRKQCIDLFSP